MTADSGGYDTELHDALEGVVRGERIRVSLSTGDVIEGTVRVALPSMLRLDAGDDADAALFDVSLITGHRVVWAVHDRDSLGGDESEWLGHATGLDRPDGGFAFGGAVESDDGDDDE